MKFIDKLTNMLMSRNDDEYEEDEFEEEEEMEEIRETRQVVNGPAVSYSSSKPAATSNVVSFSRPKLTVHETRVRELSVQIFSPVRFDQAAKIADTLIANRAAIVNYDKVEQIEQRRICDFLNGVCYVVDGEPHRINEQMVIYVPSGVDVSKAKSFSLHK